MTRLGSAQTAVAREAVWYFTPQYDTEASGDKYEYGNGSATVAVRVIREAGASCRIADPCK